MDHIIDMIFGAFIGVGFILCTIALGRLLAWNSR